MITIDNFEIEYNEIPLVLTDELNVPMPYKWHLIPMWKFRVNRNEI